MRIELVNGLPSPWNARLGRSNPSTAGQTFPGEPGQYVSRNMLKTQAWDGALFPVRSFRVSCAVTHTTAGKKGGDYRVSKLEVEDIERRYVRNAKTTRDHTRTTPGAEETRFVAAYANVASENLARWAIGLIRPAYLRGLPITDCVCIASPPQSPFLYACHGDFKAF